MATTTATAKAGVKHNVGKSRASLSQMETFVWVGLDKRGQRMKGEMTTKTASLVKAELRRQGINPQSVKAKPKPLFGKAGKSIKPRDISVFSRQLATMMAAGVPMVQGFEIVAGGQNNPRVKDMLVDIKTEIEGGSALNEALGKYPVQFDELYRNLVKAGESAGVLDTVLDTIANYQENIEAIKGKIKKAMFYPAMVLSVAVIVSAILLIFVIPQFRKCSRVSVRIFPRSRRCWSAFHASWFRIGGSSCCGLSAALLASLCCTVDQRSSSIWLGAWSSRFRLLVKFFDNPPWPASPAHWA